MENKALKPEIEQIKIEIENKSIDVTDKKKQSSRSFL